MDASLNTLKPKILLLITLVLSAFLTGCEKRTPFPVNRLTIGSTVFENTFENVRFTPMKSVEIFENGNIQQNIELQTISFNIRLSNLVPEIEQSTQDLISVTIQSGNRLPLNIKDFRLKQDLLNDSNVDIPLYQSIISPTMDRYIFLNNENTFKSFWCRMYENRAQFCIGSHNISSTAHYTYKLNFKYIQYWSVVDDYLSEYILTRVVN